MSCKMVPQIQCSYLVLQAIVLITTAYFAASVEICQTEIFNAQCADDEVIVMTSATYGRMKLGRCVKKDIIGDLGCQADVISVIDKMCSGRHKCEVRIPDAELDSANACNGELKSYLEASYTCIKVVAPMNRCSDSTPIKLTEPSGYISSYIASFTGCGLESAPWIIQARPGQFINLTFYEFTPEMDIYRGANDALDETHCKERAFIMDKYIGRKIKICPSSHRVNSVYISSNNTIDVVLRSDSEAKERNHFLIKYQFIGCPHKLPPTGMIFVRTGTMTGKMSCLNSQQTFDLFCKDGEWTGEIENCTVLEETTTAGLVSQDETAKKGVLNGLLVVVLIAVCLVLVSIIVAIFVFCVKRLRHSNEPLHECVYEHEESPYGKTKVPQCTFKQLHVEMETRGCCREEDVMYKPFIQKVPPNGMIQNQISSGGGGECLLCGEQGSREMIIEDEQNLRNTYAHMNTTKNPRVYNTANYSPKESNIENDKRLKKQQQNLNTGAGNPNNKVQRPNSLYSGGNNKQQQRSVDAAQTMDPRMMNQTFDLDPSAMYPRNYACTPVKRTTREPIYVAPPSVDMLNNTL